MKWIVSHKIYFGLHNCAANWPNGPRPNGQNFLGFGLDWRRGGSEAQRNAAPPVQTEATGCRDERGFWRLERTRRKGGGDAFSPWNEPKLALVAAGKTLAATCCRFTGQICRSKFRLRMSGQQIGNWKWRPSPHRLCWYRPDASDR